MQIKFKPSIAKQDKLLIVPLFLVKKKLFSKPIPIKFAKIAEKLYKSKDFLCKNGELYSYNSENRVIFLGLGEKEKLTSGRARNSFAHALKKAKSLKINNVSVLLHDELAPYSQALAEGIFLSNFQLSKHKTGKNLKESLKSDIKAISFICKNKKLFSESIKKALLISNAVNKVKELVNAPANLLSPMEFALKAKELAKNNKYDIEILEKSDLKKLGLNAILAVNSGADTREQEARMIILKYLPIKNSQPIVIVGKGIIFDTGGYNLKTGKSIYDMQSDKAGACAVFGIFELLSSLKIQQNVIGIMPVMENLVGPKSFKPGDIVKSYSGKTIEVVDTDAEGRLILADAISYAIKNFKPKYLIDIATLTGACVVALGDRYAGLMGNDKNLKKLIRKSANNTDELVWPLPLHPDFEKKIKSKIADIQNVDEGTGYMAGASKGGAFLKNFIEKTHWLHLDIAGVAYTKDPKPYEQEKGTGFGVRLLVDFLENLK